MLVPVPEPDLSNGTLPGVLSCQAHLVAYQIEREREGFCLAGTGISAKQAVRLWPLVRTDARLLLIVCLISLVLALSLRS